MILTTLPVLDLAASGMRYQPRTMSERNAPFSDLISNCLSSAKAESGRADVSGDGSALPAVLTTAPLPPLPVLTRMTPSGEALVSLPTSIIKKVMAALMPMSAMMKSTRPMMNLRIRFWDFLEAWYISAARISSLGSTVPSPSASKTFSAGWTLSGRVAMETEPSWFDLRRTA